MGDKTGKKKMGLTTRIFIGLIAGLPLFLLAALLWKKHGEALTVAQRGTEG